MTFQDFYEREYIPRHPPGACRLLHLLGPPVSAAFLGVLLWLQLWWALVLVYPTITIPFCTWLLMGFFKTVPMEMEEAARVDGCGYLGALLRVVLPVSIPGILTAVIFAFTLSMQDFLYGLAFVAPGDQKPVTVGVPTELIRGDVYYWGSLMAAALMVGLPVAILYNFFLDRFIQGITGGVGK